MQFHDLVTLSHGNAPLSGVGCEPSLLPQSRRLRPKMATVEWDGDYIEHLLRRIERNPRDLRAHTQRVLMLASKDDRSATFGALADLFIALGRFGYELRYSLLQQLGSACVKVFSLTNSSPLAVTRRFPLAVMKTFP